MTKKGVFSPQDLYIFVPRTKKDASGPFSDHLNNLTQKIAILFVKSLAQRPRWRDPARKRSFGKAHNIGLNVVCFEEFVILDESTVCGPKIEM